ncbi:hypothetical protein OR1_01097 [Geobacter sp. OR-1]|uniref:DUF2914 domain-containing protein n=1 Tax=Geobacter sp. OR-1 TaxID=1266765 RepID=UPI0005427577|nr:DUF2914 domain-containing protein [Geobacter sp. OR-1]GAM08823.1 hypothetical protein OR1_01097 [Geobacter sp. OR-1]
MKKITILTFVLMIGLTLLFSSSPEAASLKITEMAVTTKVVRGNPIDSVHRISSSSVRELYCFTRLVSDEEGETTVKHIWYRGNEKMGESELPVKGKKWRTYSSRVVGKGMAGDWRVDALDSEGKLLRSVKFRMN